MSCFIVQGLSKSDWMFFDINRVACRDVVGLFKGWHLFSPVYPEVFLLDVLDNQVVPLHLELFRHRQRLGVILWILWWNRPGHSALVAGLACQGSILPYLSFCKYRFLLLRKLTRKRFFHPQHTSARPMPRTAATKSSLRLPLILIQMYLKQTKGIFLSQLSQKLLLVNKERMAWGDLLASELLELWSSQMIEPSQQNPSLDHAHNDLKGLTDIFCKSIPDISTMSFHSSDKNEVQPDYIPCKNVKGNVFKNPNRFLPEAAETAGACSCSWFIYMDSHFPNSTTGQSAIYFEQSNLLPFLWLK